ncbi:efflux RND transporter periplasmic adaptor subunit [Aquisalimonas asiatica]|uniref:Membrane fusion protein, multidrug efflux system n=1 Tax=Aquisalimonas asiatica TaxID=406100 RepID=A0A1H8V723_9GAMM|nr:efflux RND transporter periplasmic adaptor subunit [Aquisalimonas asiatica]SEP11064.1 membrane fusion protein, multidrug efflux system [Aquisalimonas asiatica]
MATFFRLQHQGRRIAVLTASVIAALLLTACSGDDGESGESEQPPPPVTVAAVSPTTVDVEQDYAGRVHGAREVEVRARVEGILEERLYQEGQMVERGEALFRIDPEPFEARLEEAEAQRESARADLEEAEREWRRIERLYERDAISERERDSARSAVTLARAAVSVAEAQVTQARLQLDYATVEAPVSGVTSLEAVPEGSLLDPGTLLTTIVQHDPVHVRFALPEDDAAIQRTARRARAAAGDDQDYRREAALLLPEGGEYDQDGVVDFTASTIDHGTGSVTARAVFDNPDGTIIPGQFVRIRVVLETLDDIFRVPETVISEGADGPQLYVVDDDGNASARAVELGPVVDGDQVVLSGLDDGDRVIINGHASVGDGAPVDITDEEDI